MTSEERQKRIEEYVQRVEFASLEELAQHVGASTSTVRRDLTLLEGSRNLKRTRGGARLIAPPSDEFVFTARETHQLTEKEAIGRACAELIRPGQSIVIDAGTTVFHVARHLVEKPLQITTNSVPVVNLFASAGRTEVVVAGGVLYPRLGVLVGSETVQAFSKLRAEVAIMGAGGITSEGVTNSHGLLIDIQRAIINSAQRVILCLDHTKFNRHSFSPLCGLEMIDTIVTDSQPPAELMECLRARQVEVVIAPLTAGNGASR